MPSDVKRQAFKGSLKLCKTFNVYLKLLISILHSTLYFVLYVDRRMSNYPNIISISQCLSKDLQQSCFNLIVEKAVYLLLLRVNTACSWARPVWSLECGVWTHHSFSLQTIKLGRGRITPKSDWKLHNLMIADLKTFNKKYCYLQSNKNF